MSDCRRITGVPVSGKPGDFTNQQKPPQDQQIIHGRTGVGMAFDTLFEISKRNIIEQEKNSLK